MVAEHSLASVACSVEVDLGNQALLQRVVCLLLEAQTLEVQCPSKLSMPPIGASC